MFDADSAPRAAATLNVVFWSLHPTVTHCVHLVADKGYSTPSKLLHIDFSTRRSMCRLSCYVSPGRKQTSSHLKYNSQNKSPVYCQTTNFAHTSKQAVVKEKVADKTKRKRKEALFFGLTLPYKQTSYGTAKVHTLNLLECSEFNSCLFCLDCFTLFP